MANELSGCSRRTVLKGLAAGSVACALSDAGGYPAGAAEGGRHGKLQRTTPEAVGVDPGAVLAFVEEVERKLGGLHSFMLLRHGQVAAEGWWAPYAPRHPHMLYSLSKSFTSTAVGFAVAEGLMNVDAPVTSFFRGSLPAKIDEHLSAMQVRHLLSMSTGHDKDATGPTTRAADGDWVKAFLALPVEHQPGTRFVYNSAATYMLSAIVQKLAGVPVLQYLQSRLFGPLGIEGPTWETCPRGINTGGWGLSVKTEDIARFGQTYLQHGKWNGKQVVPEAWVSEATGRHISNGANPESDWAQGYGYQFWRCRHGAYRGDGAFGQFCVVLPEQDAVVAITSGLGDMQAVLNSIWNQLLPGIVGKSPVESGAADLKRRLAALTVPVPAGTHDSSTAKRVSGKTYRFDANDEKLETAVLTFRGDQCTAVLHDARGDRRLVCAGRQWAPGTAPLNEHPDAKVAARGVWVDDDTFTMKLAFYETPYVQTLTWKFSGDQLTVSRKQNVGFGPTEQPALLAHSV